MVKRFTRQQRSASPEPGQRLPSRMPADHAGVLIGALIMVVSGILGLFYIFNAWQPRIGAELWVFFLLVHLTVTGIAIPIVRYINVRFTPITDDPPPGGIIVRQSTWIGLYAVICSWLQMQRGLSITIAVFLPLVFIVIEVFLRTREINAEE